MLIRIFIIVLSIAIVDLPAMAQENRMMQIVAPKTSVHRSDETPSRKVSDLIEIKNVAGQSIMMSQTRLKKGGKSPHHNHPEEEFMVVISGKLRVQLADGYEDIGPGDFYTVESYSEHQIEALEDTFIIEAFGPGRVVMPVPGSN